MDALSIVGLLVGLLAIVIGNSIEGGSLGELINFAAFIIVIGGSIGATLLQSTLSDVRGAVRILPWVVFPPRFDLDASIRKLVHWGDIARRQGLLGLESIADEEADEFARRGLWLLVDGYDINQIRHILGSELVARENDGIRSANVWEAMGGYAPTIGIVGAVLGLIQVMYNLADPALLGPGIATAFVATIYGVGLANLVLLPIAEKIKSVVLLASLNRELIIEGMVALAEGDNPRMIQMKLKGFSAVVDA